MQSIFNHRHFFFLTFLSLLYLLSSCGNQPYDQAKKLYWNESKGMRAANDRYAEADRILSQPGTAENFDSRFLLWKTNVQLGNRAKSDSLYSMLIKAADFNTNTILDRLNREDERMRESILTLYQHHKAPDAINSLISILQNDEYENVQRSAAKALTFQGDTLARQPLLQKLDSRFDLVREYALESLVAFADLRVIGRVKRIVLDPATAPGTRFIAARNLGKMLRTNPSELDRAEFTRAGAELPFALACAYAGIPVTNNPISDWLESRDKLAQSIALEILSLSGSPKSLAVLKDKLKFGNTLERIRAVELLALYSNSDKNELVELARNDANPNVRERVQQLFKQ